MDAARDPRVDAWLDGLLPWQRVIAERVRAIVHAADPGIVETIKRTDRPYFVLDGNVCALLAAKRHVTVFVYDPDVPDPAGLINQGEGNATARSIRIAPDTFPDEAAFVALLRAVVARNRAGGWRRLAH
ncbi:MAG: DUF1801 domain-containing protein [Jatrophihabitans sp.]|uniref:DUF1801 domain-containing protein n=1 Tax=Jatrophihabitans sp. TaxID=1932789 RepID=UPI003F7F27AA